MSKLDKKFRMVLSQISNQLTTDDVKSFVFMLGNSPIPAQALEMVKTGEDMFNLMIKHGLLSKTDTVELVNMLEQKGYQPCIEILHCFCTENKDDIEKAKEGPCNIQDDLIVEHFKETNKLQELEVKLSRSNFVSLSGLLGCGKSQLALKYACKFRQNNLAGICWRIICQNNVTLVNSLKRLVNEFGLEEKTTQAENIGTEDFLYSLGNLILKEICKNDQIQHLLILDDVTDETKHVCEKLKNKFKSRLNVRTIVTTCNYSFCNEVDIIPVQGFTIEEAIEFLKENKDIKPGEEASYSELAKHLACLPLLLYGARTCMRSSHQSPKRFLRYLKGSNSLSNIDKFVRSSSEPSENKEVFKVLKSYLEKLKEEEGPDVFDMILCLQFLGLEDIPVLLLDFLPTNDNKNHRGSNTTAFIQAIQKFSFGMLRGEDDDRLISTHVAVIKTLESYTSDEDKARLIKKLLTALMWLMDKDNNNTKDYKRNECLLPHALSLLQHVKTLQEVSQTLHPDIEFNILLAYVNDIVGYTYNFFGILKNAGEHSTAARKACFNIIGMPEDELEDIVKKICSRDEHHKSWECFAECEANLIFTKLKAVLSNSDTKTKLNKLTKNLVLNKYRGQDHIILLQEFLESDLSDEYILSEREYRQLQGKDLAVPEGMLGELFLLELILQVFYTFGRRIFYLGDAFEKGIARTFAHSLFLAHALGAKIDADHEYKEWPLLYVMLTKQSGILELGFEDKADLHIKTLDNLENAAEQFRKMLQSDQITYNYGLVKSTPGNLQNEHICYKRLVRCYTSMSQLTSDEETKLEIKKKGEIYNKKLNETQQSCRQVESANLRMAEFFLQHEKYEKAEQKFKIVSPEDMIVSEDEEHNSPDIEMHNSRLSNRELQALKGLTKCYAKSGKTSLAKSLANRVMTRLEVTKENEELDHFRKMFIDLKLS